MNFTSVLWVTVSASALDSLNPIAIAQQFMLQSLARKKGAIVGFIAGIGLTNFAAGLLVYYGLAALFANWLGAWAAANGGLVRAAALAAGLLCTAAGLWLGWKKWLRPTAPAQKKPEADGKKPLSLSWPSLFLMGALFCLFELTSALPYFAYLAFFVQVQYPVWGVVGILLLYNLIYSLPLILLLAASVFFHQRLAAVYRLFQRVIAAVLRVAPPVILLALGALGILYGAGVL